MSETNNLQTIKNTELDREHQPVGDVMSVIKEQTSDITIKEEYVRTLTEIMQNWNDCILYGEDPKRELEKIEIDNFNFSYDEFKNLVDSGILSTQYYTNYFRGIPELEGRPLSTVEDLDILEANLDIMMPSMSKDGIFNMMIYNLAKHSSISDKVELHYVSNNIGNKIPDILAGFKNLNENIIKKSGTNGKVHFILADISKTEDKVISGHIIPYIIIDGEIFEFDAISSGPLLGNEHYSTKYLQQTDQTSCRAIAIREVDNFLKILKNLNSVEKFSKYLKQFFSKDKIEYYVDPLTNSLREGPKEAEDPNEAKRNRRLAILPFPITKNSQSYSAFEVFMNFIQNLEENHKDLPDNEKEKFIRENKHILEMKDKIVKLTKRFGIQKKISKNETKKINAYTLKERLRQAKVLSILTENGLIKSLEDVEEYKNTEKGKAAIATINEEWIKDIMNNITEINKLKIEGENSDKKQEIDTENYNDKEEETEKMVKYNKKNEINEEDINYKREQEILQEKPLEKQFFTASKMVEQQISNQNELRQQSIKNELDNKMDIEAKEQGV